MGTVANLAIRVGVNATDVEKGMGRVAGAVEGVSSRLGKVGAAVAGAFSINAIGHAAEQAIHTASRIADMAERVGISAEAVQKLEFAATQSGSSFDAIATSIRVMAGHLDDGKIPKGLTDMGLSVQALKNMTPDQAFIAIANAIKDIPDPLRQSATAVDIFGRGAQQILPAIKGGIEAIGNAAPQMSNQTIAAIDASGDKWAALHLQLGNLQAQALQPLLTAFLSLPSSLQVTAAGIATFLPSLEGIGIAILAAGGPTAAFGMLAAAAGGVATFFAATLPAAFGAVLAFLGPQGIIALAVLALGLIWYNWGDEITAVVKGVYTGIKTWLVDSWATIGPAISAGVGTVVTFFTDAMNALVSLAQNAYTNIKGWLADKWSVLATAASTAFAAVSTAFLTMKNALVTYAQQTYEGVKAWLVDKFTAVVEAIRQKVAAVSGFFRDMYDKVVGGSYVPDMVRGIQSEFGKLGSVMVGPAQAATNAVDGIFRSLTNKVSGYVSEMVSGFASKMGGGIGGLLGGPLGSIAGNLIGGGIGWLSGKIGGLFGKDEESKLVNPARDQFSAPFVGKFGGSNSDAITKALEAAGLGGERASALMTAFNSADTMQQFNAASSAITSAIAETTSKNDLFNGSLDTSNTAISQLGTSMNIAVESMLAGLNQIVPRLDDLVSKLSMASALAASLTLTTGMGDGGGASGEIPSYANEGYRLTTPHLAMVGDASQPEYVLHEDTVQALAGGVNLTLGPGSIVVNASNPDDFARQVVPALIKQIGRFNVAGARRKMQNIVNG